MLLFLDPESVVGTEADEHIVASQRGNRCRYR